MNKDNKNTEVNDTDKKLHISDVSDSLWDHGTCWVLSPVTNAKTTHISRRNKETEVVQFYVDDKTCDNGEGYWLDFNRGWWDNFIPNSDICSLNTKFNKMEEDKNLEQNLDKSNEKLHISDVSKRSNLKNELVSLHIELNSRYGAYGHIEPSLEQQKIIRDRIDEINEELENVC